jgi:excinuclease ABC subunit A
MEDKGRKDWIRVLGARVHNLKNIDVDIPRNQLTVITGLSGSGKSSLAFDTIYAEGQRRYIETMSSYARQFLGNMERPDVDKITGLSPVISIEQKTTNKNPRSTVGTITEVYDFLRLLYARTAQAFSWETGELMVKYTDEQIINLIIEKYSGLKIFLLSPIIKGRKGHYKELFESFRKKGFLYARIDGKIEELRPNMKVDRYKAHNIELLIDKLDVSEKDKRRLGESLTIGMDQGKGIIMILEKDSSAARYFSRQLMCPTTGISYNEPAPHTFSFNSPHGACPKCNGLGEISQVEIKSIIPDPSLNIKKGGFAPLGALKNSLIFWQIESIVNRYGYDLNTPLQEMSEETLNKLLYGSDEPFRLTATPLGMSSNYFLSFDGIISYIQNHNGSENSRSEQKWAGQFIRKTTCPECNGGRLKKEALHFKLDGKNIADLVGMDINELYTWFANVESRLSEKQNLIAKDILKEIRNRLKFLLNVGLTYLTLNRASRSLSGGESQRIRLATQIGSQLVNVLYILDEPSIGLHQRDNLKLIQSLRELRDTGNSIIVVEHDREMIESADYVVDMGPFAGRHGGQVVASGPPEIMRDVETLTSDYLYHRKEIVIPKERKKGNGKSIILKGAKGNNLKNVSVEFPLGIFICVTGVSGSGKSSLINETLHPILNKHFYRALQDPLEFDSISGIENIDKVIEVDQSPLGRTPRSNPATYTGVFTDVRKLFEMSSEAKVRGYTAGRFSFNVSGGRCETCKGAGVQTIEMNFLPDVYVTCKDCNGHRYNRETLEIKYKGKNISEVLNLTINQSLEFFTGIPSILRKIKTIKDVGLGYIKLGQPSTTLSGGESQRIKLAAELAKKDTGQTLYILDEPTTGLHFEDVRVLLEVTGKLVSRGNTVIMIEHNMDVIKTADYVIDIGPEGGNAGGKIIAQGSPEELAEVAESYTGQFLRKELHLLID